MRIDVYPPSALNFRLGCKYNLARGAGRFILRDAIARPEGQLKPVGGSVGKLKSYSAGTVQVVKEL